MGHTAADQVADILPYILNNVGGVNDDDYEKFANFDVGAVGLVESD